ncbi:MAG TPA: ABC transporter permease [Bryobacteraceae bacterium]|nr:ABC transporter permease [Bryobacteraceae bacterium]
MSVWSRIGNLFKVDRLSREIDEELNSHIQEAIEEGRDPAEVRKAFGSLLRHREESRDLKLIVWLDSVRADLLFGWRQLAKKPATSAAVILSLALAIGSCTSVFRLIDALLLRPLPVKDADRLYVMVLHGVGPDGSVRDSDANEYPQFVLMRAAVKKDAELIAASFGGERVDLTFGSDAEMEKAHRQYVSGWMFNSFGLKPALGRLLIEDDDRVPKAKPYAVLSYDYWVQRFGRDPKVIGRKFQMGNDLYEIVGVAPKGFTGTEPGTFSDIFLPMMMYEGVTHNDWSWFRTFVQLKPDGSIQRVRDHLQAVWTAVQTEVAKGFTSWPPDGVRKYLQQSVIVVQPAAAGVSDLRQTYRIALLAIGVIVALVMLIACVNVANLLTAQAAARSREMALRVSIGAGKWRLIQMMLIECALVSVLATLAGALFAWWAAPFIVARINPPDNPARLVLSADWRVMGFAVALSITATFLFGLLPALRTSKVDPVSALKGGDDPHSRRRLMHALIAFQVAFCFVVHFGAGAFVSTLHRLSNQPTGFSAERLLTLETVSKATQSTEVWFQAADHLRALSGVESVAIAGWPLLSGNGSNGFVSVNGAPPAPLLAYFLPVSPDWLETMKIPFMGGRDFRRNETKTAVAVVNAAFAKEYFHGEDPIGKSFNRGKDRFQVIGLVRNARYRNMREPITPTAYIPLGYSPTRTQHFFVRTSNANPMVMAPMLRREISRARPELRVSNVITQLEINQAQTVRERLLATLALFFAVVAVLLAGIGLYGVLDYSVLQRRRELGIRIAIGAPVADIAGRVTIDIFFMVLLGAVVGGGVGVLLEPYVKTLLYEVQPSNLGALVFPFVVILVATVLAALPAAIRAIRIDPVTMLRAE